MLHVVSGIIVAKYNNVRFIRDHIQKNGFKKEPLNLQSIIKL